MGKARHAVRPTTLPLQKVLRPPVPLSCPGVLILSLTREPVYMTPSAHKLLAELDGSTDASGIGAALPFVVIHVCNELEHDGKQVLAGTDWEKMHVRHLARTAHGTILVRGYGILEQRGAQTGRFLILLETVPAESSLSNTDGATDSQFTGYQFTDRQRAILNGLVLGLTNKAIAESMLISVHTVKEYIRQLMMKLHTPTRTGIVARVAGLTLPSPKASGQRKSRAAPATAQVA